MSSDLTLEEWVLAFLYADPTRETSIPKVRGKLLLFKQFFVFVKEIERDLDRVANFIPYDYGPYSFELQNALDNLVIRQDISLTRSGDRIDFSLTENGMKTASKIFSTIPDLKKEKMEKLRQDANNLGYNGVLRYVYARYPEFTTLSKIKHRVMNGS